MARKWTATNLDSGFPMPFGGAAVAISEKARRTLRLVARLGPLSLHPGDSPRWSKTSDGLVLSTQEAAFATHLREVPRHAAHSP